MSSIPTYIYDREPYKFGVNQQEYVKRSDQIVEEASEKIVEARANKGDLKTLFFTLFDRFAMERNAIAVKHRTPHSQAFGEKRGTVLGLYSTTLDMEYRDYGARIKKILQDCLRKMEENKTSKKTFSYGKDKSCLEVEILDPTTIKSRGYTTRPEETLKKGGYVIPPTINKMISDGFKCGDLSITEILPKEEVLKMKKERRELYNQFFNFQKYHYMESDFPASKASKNKKSFLVKAIVKNPVENKMYHVCEYLTWLSGDDKSRAIDRMVNDSEVFVIHMDSLNINQAMVDLSILFERAVKTFDKVSLGEFRRLFGFVMPLCRGSAGITEWYERAISKSHNHRMTYKSTCHPDLESITQPDSQKYVNNYESGAFSDWTPIKPQQ